MSAKKYRTRRGKVRPQEPRTPNSHTSSTLKAALYYAERFGWHVFPVGDDKKPLCPHGLKEATKDPQTIRELWRNVPPAGVAMTTGAESGVVVLDIDPKNGGKYGLDELEKEIAIPHTVESLTGGGGRHLFFKHPGVRIPNSVSKLGPGLDVRGDGGYVVLPPSKHTSGKRYEWEASSRPDAMGLSELGPRLLARLRGPALYENAPSAGDALIPLGSRNDTLASLGGTMRRKGMTREAIEAALLADNSRRCQPPLTDSEVRTIAASVARYPPAEATVLSPTGGADNWPEIVPFGAPADLPQFPLEVLPPALRHYVEDVAESRGVPPDLPGLLALAVVAAASARRVRVQIGETHSEPTNLFVAVTLESGSRKSDTLRDMVTPLEDEEVRLLDEARPRIAKAREMWEAEEARLKHLRMAAAKADHPEERALLLKEAKRIATARTAVPPEPRLIVGDTTAEILATRLHENQGRMALMDGEAGGVFETMGGRYSNGNVPNLDVYLRGHAGDTIRVDRVGRPAELVSYPALTVALCPQPIVLENLGKRPEFRGRGLVARFIYAVPRSLAGRRSYRNRPVAASARRDYRAALLRAMRLPSVPKGSPFPWHVVKLSGPALELWRKFHDRCEIQLGDDGNLSGIRDWGSKLAGVVARIAANLHIVAEQSPLESEISRTTLAAARALGKYLIPHALTAFAMMGTDQRISMAQRIRDWIIRTNREEFSLREVHRIFRASVARSQELIAPLEVLEDRGYVRRLPDINRANKPGRPSGPRYRSNPLLLKKTKSFVNFVNSV